MTLARACPAVFPLWGVISGQTISAPDIWEPVRFFAGVWEGAAEPVLNGVLRFSSEGIENIPMGFRARETYTFTGLSSPRLARSSSSAA